MLLYLPDSCTKAVSLGMRSEVVLMILMSLCVCQTYSVLFTRPGERKIQPTWIDDMSGGKP